MKISIISSSELDDALINKWRQIQRAQDDLRSPFYCPEFTQHVSDVRPDARVALIEDGGQVQGFFPFQRDSLLRLHPIGMGLNAYHGLIRNAEFEIPASMLLRACGGVYFAFNHMPITQSTFSPHIHTKNSSPILNVQGGWDEYIKRLKENQNTNKPGILASVKKSENRLERDIGPLRFEINERNPVVLNELMRLKSEQWVRTVGASKDTFALPWVKKLLTNIFETQGRSFGGNLCALYSGEELVAAYFGIRANDLLHSWFLVYETKYAYYQPGVILLKKLAENSFQEGINLIDLGRGTQDYKMRFNTGVIPLGEGAISNPSWIGGFTKVAKKVKTNIKNDPRIISFRKFIGK